MEASLLAQKGIPRLDALPEELVSGISYRLDCDDIASLRLTCKALEAGTFFQFRKEYFSRRAFLLTSESLRILNGIASSERLRHHLREVYLVAGYFPTRAIAGHTCGFAPTTRQREAYITYAIDQRHLKKTREDLRKISEAFGKLRGLEALTLCDTSERVPLDVDIAGVSLGGMETHPFGIIADHVPPRKYRKFGRRTSSNPSFDLGFFSHVWRTLLSAVATSGISTLAEIKTSASQAHGLAAAKDLVLNKTERERSRTALSSLKTLSLRIRTQLVLKETGLDVEATGKRLAKFASVLPAINSLDLSWDGAPSTGLLCSRFVAGLNTSLLTYLCLDALTISVPELTTMLSTCSLVKFRIAMADLTDGTWVPILKALQRMQALDQLDLMFVREGLRKVYFLFQRESEARDEEMEVTDIFSFLGPPPVHALDGDGDGGGSESGDDGDDELPTLEPGVPAAIAGASHPAQATVDDVMEGVGDEAASGADSGNSWQRDGDELDYDQEDRADPADEEEDFKAPGMGDMEERGYYICLKSKDAIAKWLPTFIKQYNLGEAVEPHWSPPGVFGIPFPAAPNAGQTASQNGGPGSQLLNSLMSLTGGLPPMPPAGVAVGGFAVGAAPPFPPPPPPPGPAAASSQDASNNVAQAGDVTTTTATGAALANTGSGGGDNAQAPAQSTTAIHDFADTGDSAPASVQGPTMTAEGVAIPDPWMLDDGGDGVLRRR